MQSEQAKPAARGTNGKLKSHSSFSKKLKTVVSHMFSKKALGYRAFTISWTFIAVAGWNYYYFREFAFSESLEVTATIVIGKFLFYGFWEYRHLDEINLSAVYDDEGPDPSQG